MLGVDDNLDIFLFGLAPVKNYFNLLDQIIILKDFLSFFFRVPANSRGHFKMTPRDSDDHPTRIGANFLITDPVPKQYPCAGEASIAGELKPLL